MNNYKLFIAIIVLTSLFTGCKKDEVIEPTKSDAKQITSFVFLLSNNPIEEIVIAKIDEESKKIFATMPPGTKISGLLPEIKTSALATVNPNTARDFTNAIDYTVTAEDGSVVIYTVNVVALLSQKQILQVILDANPDNILDWDLQNTSDLGFLSGVSTNVEGRIIELDLSFRSLNKLPEEIGQLINLSVLNLDHNQFTTLPPEIVQMINLKVLLLRANQLSSIPVEIVQLTNLEILGLGHNNITSIPEEIELLINLSELDLFANLLATLPLGIGQLINLSKLNLSNNQITTLPTEIGQLINLLEMRISNNQLTTLPPEIGFLKNLTLLELRNNSLTTMSNAVRNLAIYNNMELRLDIGIELETNSPKDALISIYSANPGNTLDWSIDNFPEVSFNASGNPTAITTNNKNLIRLTNNIDQLTALVSLNMNSNNLQSIPSSIGNIGTLEFLTLATNQLGTLPSQLGQLRNLALLSLTGNPITSIPQSICDLQTSNGGILTILTDPGEGCD